MDFLDEMMKQYLGEGKLNFQPTDKSCDNLHQQSEIGESVSTHTHASINCDSEITVLREKISADDIQEMKFNPSSSHSIENHEFLSPLWSMEPRIFALETSSSGKRKYIVGNLGRFFSHYWRKSDPLNRHYYELIRESTPCRLYFGACWFRFN
jgi:hypothetical protein